MESVLAQSFTDWEMIVVNDGSTDGSPQYLHDLAKQDDRVRVIDQSNQGQNAAANHAISLAKAPLVARMDADDVCDLHRLEKQVAFMRDNPTVGLLGTQIRRLGDRRSGLHSSFPTDHDEIVSALLQNHHAICNPTIVFRRSLFEQIGGYWEHNIAEDWDMFLRMAEVSRLANLDEVLFSYRFHRGSINGRRIVEAQLFNEYAASQWHLRRQDLPGTSFEQFISDHRSSRWPTSWLFSIDSHSIGQYRQAVAEIYSGRSIRGSMRLCFAMAMSPLRTLRRAKRMSGRILFGSDQSVVHADPVQDLPIVASRTERESSSRQSQPNVSTNPDDSVKAVAGKG
ncbi:putative glycosyltransferase EpsE [Rubripirellula obstinata]|uniref:Putative glycosyltransferase EpsE n=2 Tax=Rubripirellula obstinata TaxID=406547 RepID=A0A5B1CF34_9BACT|nr:putative glycosyltransferase EpsE [Rubripirellula obstinata]